MTPVSRKPRLTLLSALLLCVAFAGIGHADDLPSVELPPPLARVLTDYETAWQAKDAMSLSANNGSGWGVTIMDQE